jgi:hypothetical protein
MRQRISANALVKELVNSLGVETGSSQTDNATKLQKKAFG